MTEPFIAETGKTGNILRLLSAAAAVVMVLTGIIAYGAPAGQLLILLLYFVLYVQLPGMFIVRRAVTGRLRLSTYLMLSAFTGWAFIAADYFVSDAVGSDIMLITAGPLLSAAFVYFDVLRAERKDLLLSRFSPGKLAPAFCVFMALVLLYCMVNTQFRYMAPEMSGHVYVNPDKAYHMGLINSLSHGYPLESPWVKGRFLKYHIFTEILFAVPVRLFGVRADAATQSFGPLLTAYIVGVSYYSFCREMTRKPKRAGIYCLLFIAAYMYAARRLTSSFAYKIIFTNDNYAGYGLAAMLMTTVAYAKWYDAFCRSIEPGAAGTEKSKPVRSQYALLALTTALLMLTTGIKGPIGAVMTAGMWGTMALGMLLRRVPPKALMPLAVMTAGFLFIYMTLLGAKGQVNSPGGAALALASITDISFWKAGLTAFMKSHGIPRAVRLAAVLFAFSLSFFTVFAVPLCLGFVHELTAVVRGAKEYRPAEVLMYACAFVGFAAMMLLSFSGHSQIYFGVVSIVLAPVISYRFIEDLEDSSRASGASKRILKITAAVMAATLLFTGMTLTAYYARKIGEAAAYHADPSAEGGKYMSMSSGEYEAMRWIERNTERNALLANDRYYSTALKKYDFDNRWDNRFFLYEVYSNRLSYISGSGFDLPKEDIPLRVERIGELRELYDEKNDGRGKQAAGLGIDYVIVSKRFTGEAELEGAGYRMVFSNDDVDIYKVTE